MENNTAVSLVDGKWQSVPFPTSYTLELTTGQNGNWDAACASNPKNVIIKDSSGAVYLFDHYGVPQRLDGDAGANAIESM